MKIPRLASIACQILALSALSLISSVPAAAQDAPAAGGEKPVNAECPIKGEPIDPKCTLEYEGEIYAFCTGSCRTEWKAARESSLYHQIGGKAAIHAAVDLFYVKVLADDRVSHFFEDINMKAQIRKQKEFLSAALGGPKPWTGKDMRKAHRGLELEEAHFNVIAENLQATLEELKVKPELIAEVMAVAASTKDDVLNK